MANENLRNASSSHKLAVETPAGGCGVIVGGGGDMWSRRGRDVLDEEDWAVTKPGPCACGGVQV